MVTRTLATLLLLGACACGSVYDGTYPGETRFVVNGSVVALSNPPTGFVGNVLTRVTWQLIPVPLPPSNTQSDGGSVGAGGTIGDPNGIPNAPPPPPPPASTGSDGAVASVRFPAPLTLPLYDVPAVNKRAAALAVGVMVVFYDADNSGAFSAGDVIAGAAQRHRLIYTDGSLPTDDFASFAAQLDNPDALLHGYTLAEAACASGGKTTLHAVANTTVPFTAGDVAACP